MNHFTQFVILLLAESTMTHKECSSLEHIYIDMEITKEEENAQLKKVNSEIGRNVYPERIEATLYYTEFTSTYCPVYEFTIFEKCISKQSFLNTSATSLFEAKAKEKGIFGEDCSEGKCDGRDPSDCPKVGEIRFVEPDTFEEMQMSKSLIHHRCGVEWKNNVVTKTLKFAFEDFNKMVLFDPVYGVCELNQKKRTCRWNNGWTAIVDQIPEPISDMFESQCLSTALQTICFDDEQNSEISFQRDGYSIQENKIYRIASELVAFDDFPMKFDAGFAMASELEKVYYMNCTV